MAWRVHDFEPGGGHGHDHGLLRRHGGLRPERHGHHRDRRRQRHRRLRGNDGPAIAAELRYPFGVAVDSAGDLFIADTSNNVVREVVKSTGDIITVAGNGTAGYSGDGGTAKDAELNFPDDIAVDSAGDVFIADGTTT